MAADEETLESDPEIPKGKKEIEVRSKKENKKNPIGQSKKISHNALRKGIFSS